MVSPGNAYDLVTKFLHHFVKTLIEIDLECLQERTPLQEPGQAHKPISTAQRYAGAYFSSCEVTAPCHGYGCQWPKGGHLLRADCPAGVTAH